MVLAPKRLEFRGRFRPAPVLSFVHQADKHPNTVALCRNG